ncbi:aerobic glycerol-3-phosphate dehydrogenase [Companilactobacillus crustorum]|uniref:Alpha-glycerophosphate oxidase n=3 Tax=Companilactobacillus TaxID=2767879 RepID=A0A837RJR0_9LACO|nr:glycerol-3-phosphate dehydrogenase/oxidase [Companilactobacillus crustorum]KRK42477.1 glycerol-3-phosphate dehydrogenase [Companilactobacillus crustorum JCM 15951]KRO20165.1 glycerol-3-phosphate dehydrogenase [Companilactobacillus crustorum]GEO76814.1 aerobic glycerol-3-phosphate dehydrogenase [Companilactobacillus crustorum]
MKEFSDKTRSDNLAAMQDQVLDLLVIGGGITGSGITLDAQSRGLQTGLIEMRDFASGTSSRSTKLVHGGLRYLKQAAVKEVHEVGSERAIVYNNAPQVTTPLKMMLPFYENGTFGPHTTAIGLDVYDRLAEVKSSERKYMLNAHDTLEREPYIKGESLKGSGVYVEYRTDDARLTLEVVKKANELGAFIANYVKATGLLYDSDNKVCGVIFKNLIDGSTGEIQAKKVINACGPWVDEIREMDHSNQGKHLHLTKGVHLVIDHEKFPISNSIFFDTPFHDGRMMFAIPREGKTYIGTTDTTWNKDPKEPDITALDVTYILAAANQMFDLPQYLTPDDVESGWSGVRPLIQEEGKSPSEISRKDEIFQSKSGLLSIAGGKLTGYRKMAEKIVDRVGKQLAMEENLRYQPTTTKDLTLSGGDVGGGKGWMDFFDNAVHEGIINYDLDREEAEKLVQRYGSNVQKVYDLLPDTKTKVRLPRIDWAMLNYGLQYEMVEHPIDYLLRRSSQMLFDIEHMKTIKSAVINCMANYYHWDDEAKQQMTDEVNEKLALTDLSNIKQKYADFKND